MYKAIIAIGIAAAACLVAGCGSSGEETATAAVTKAQFIKQAEGACEKITKKRKAAAADWQREHPGIFKQTQLDDAFKEVVGPAIKEQVEALESIPAPAGDEARIGQLVENLAKAGQKISREGTRGTGAKELFEFQRLAGSYGLETCARLY